MENPSIDRDQQQQHSYICLEAKRLHCQRARVELPRTFLGQTAGKKLSAEKIFQEAEPL